MLDANGLLPTGLVKVTAEQVHEHFVVPFAASKTRQRLYDQWLLHRQAVAVIVPIERQWVNGSYVTGKVDPGDIDVVTFIDGDALNALDAPQQAILSDLMDGHSTRDRWGIDAFLVPTYAEGHPDRTAARKAEGYWRRMWTNVKGTTLTKGFLEVSA
ncbi:hypothetical protein NODU109028_06275 [Nocardioides dubius]|uniref:DUF6932 family protein n=1 Tax=Nocardioides dubius TaxID=317019 RepID=UPI0039EB368E